MVKTLLMTIQKEKFYIILIQLKKDKKEVIVFYRNLDFYLLLHYFYFKKC